VLHVIGRLILVPFAFLVAMLVTAFVLVTLGSEKVTHAVSGSEDIPFSAAFEFISYAVVLTSAFTIIPALLLVIVGEVARIRSIYYYVVGGGLAMLAVPLLAQAGQGTALTMPSTAIWHVFATSGFLGGFAYWLLAGRGA
jgi:glucan phosphoethanolaminetransferase (alkaline phosphatase superfamily)